MTKSYVLSLSNRELVAELILNIENQIKSQNAKGIIPKYLANAEVLLRDEILFRMSVGRDS